MGVVCVGVCVGWVSPRGWLWCRAAPGLTGPAVVALGCAAFCRCADYVGLEVPRLLINRERAGEVVPGTSRGFVFDGDANYRLVDLVGHVPMCLPCVQLSYLRHSTCDRNITPPPPPPSSPFRAGMRCTWATATAACASCASCWAGRPSWMRS